MEKLTIVFDKKPKSLSNKKTIISFLERHGIDYNFKTVSSHDDTVKCNKCGTVDYENSDCDECIKNTVGEVYYM
jgi:hypothetical protein